MSVYKQENSKTEVFEVPIIAGVDPGGHSSSVEKEGRGPEVDKRV